MAVVRCRGCERHRAGVSRDPFHHPDFHAALRRAPELDVVHEAPDEEDPAAARLEEILGRQRVGNRVGIETVALIAHADGQLGRLREFLALSNSTNTCLARSLRLPCLMALITHSRTATPTQCRASSSRARVAPCGR